MTELATWPEWAARAFWSALTLAVSWPSGGRLAPLPHRVCFDSFPRRIILPPSRWSVFVMLMASVTLATAGVASALADAYGAVIAPALPVSSLTRNLAWSVTVMLGLLVILNGLGLSITPMLTALGIGGLAVALARSLWPTSLRDCF